MAFIDIFNFKKYFAKPSDSQVARYGHVNAVYDALAAGSLTSANYTLPTGETELTIGTPAGVIAVTDSIAGEGSSNITLLNGSVKATSSVVFSISQSGATSAVPVIRFDITDGTITVRIDNTSTGVALDDILISYIIVY
jgi:hypothetical protein